jgi:hypothetical protein
MHILHEPYFLQFQPSRSFQHPSCAEVHIHPMIVRIPLCKCPPEGCKFFPNAGQEYHLLPHGWMPGFTVNVYTGYSSIVQCTSSVV